MSVAPSPVVTINILQAPLVDDNGRVTPSWVKWFQNISAAVNAGLTTVGTALKLPFPTPASLGGVLSVNAETGKFITDIDAFGVPHLSQPAFTDLSGTAGIPFVTFGTGVPASTGADGSIYFDTTSAPYAGYVWHGGAWVAFS